MKTNQTKSVRSSIFDVLLCPLSVLHRPFSIFVLLLLMLANAKGTTI